MKLLILINILLIDLWAIYIISKKHFQFLIEREIFTNKIESISLLKNKEWFDDGSPSTAHGIFTIPMPKIKKETR